MAKKDKIKVDPKAVTEPAEVKLTEKQKLFCSEYLIDFNASAAARRAGYSTDTAGSIGWENLKKPEIQNEIERLRQEIGGRFNITKERIALEYSRLAFFDPRNMYDADGNLKPVSDWGDDEAAAIAGVEVETEKTVLSTDALDIDDDGNLVEGYTISKVAKIKHGEKRQALDSLVKLMGYAAPVKNEFSGPGNTPLIPALNLNIVQPAKDEDADG